MKEVKVEGDRPRCRGQVKPHTTGEWEERKRKQIKETEAWRGRYLTDRNYVDAILLSVVMDKVAGVRKLRGALLAFFTL